MNVVTPGETETGRFPRIRIAFQGELGAFSEEAVREFFGADAIPLPCREFRDLGSAVLSGEADFGMLPIENTLAGSVLAAHDVLLGSDLEVVGEVIRPIRLCLLAAAGATLATVRRVLSHPVALAQCTRFLIERGSLEAIAVYDTAGAAREVAEKADPVVGAIAARGAAERYGLEILAEEIQDRDDNQTRFLVLARPGGARPVRRSAGGPTKTALEVETENRPGALVEVLLPFARRGVNLSKLESRPGGEPWTYRFFLELAADARDPSAREALEEIGRAARRLRVLGSFPSAVAGGPAPPRG
jgi:prephenate dehydratase